MGSYTMSDTIKITTGDGETIEVPRDVAMVLLSSFYTYNFSLPF